MEAYPFEPGVLDPETREFYRDVMERLRTAGVPYLIGGAFALAGYTGIVRNSKDLDLFLKPDDVARALDLLSEAGYRTEVTSSVWLAKVFSGDAFVDLIFRSGNSISEVDDEWFSRTLTGTLLGVPVQLCAPEETLWSKAFIMERERFDGPDVAHYLLSWARRMDWGRLLRRFGPHWRVLFSHLVLFGFIYPGKRDLIPRAVMEELIERLGEELVAPAPETELCQGTLLSRTFFLVDVGPWGFTDARLIRPSLSEELESALREEIAGERDYELRRAGISLEASTKRPLQH